VYQLYIKKKKKRKSTLEQPGNYFEKMYSLCKDRSDRALKYYRNRWFKGETGKCNFKMKKTSAAFPLA
jgi:hypothetical protein